MKPISSFLFGVASYLVFLVSLSGFLLWVMGVLLPFSIRHPAPAHPSPSLDLVWNGFLLFGFCLLHSTLARPKIGKKVLSPNNPLLRRSWYVLLASLHLDLVMLCFRPVPQTVWDLTETPLEPLIWTLALGGWVLALVASFQIGHLELFGLEPSSRSLRKGEPPAPEFRAPGLYAWVRHPMMTGFLLALWATPWMTLGQLGFSLGWTVYVHLALSWEEADLIQELGEPYQTYRSKTPRLLPFRFR